jgi:hypothetical protein
MKPIGLMSILVLASMSPAYADCDVSFNGTFDVLQRGPDNATSNVYFDLIQSGRTVQGSAQAVSRAGSLTGTAKGTVSDDGRSVDLVVVWNYGGAAGYRGQYVWRVDRNGNMTSGKTTDLQDRNKTGVLSSNSSFCQ